MSRLSLLLLLLAGCGTSYPSQADLYGDWSNVDSGTNRVFEFKASSTDIPELSGKSNVYTIYSYVVGAAPAAVQSGTYDIIQGSLVTHVLKTGSAPDLGKDFSNGIVTWNAGKDFTLDKTTGANGERTFTKVSALP